MLVVCRKGGKRKESGSQLTSHNDGFLFFELTISFGLYWALEKGFLSKIYYIKASRVAFHHFLKVSMRYRVAENFRGVLIFIIFVVDLHSRKFPPPKINDYRHASIEEGHGQKYRGSTATRSLC
jgi:hypothetical protein